LESEFSGTEQLLTRQLGVKKKKNVSEKRSSNREIGKRKESFDSDRTSQNNAALPIKKGKSGCLGGGKNRKTKEKKKNGSNAVVIPGIP